MKSIITITLILIFNFSYGQGYPPVENAEPSTEEIANTITDKYDSELAMTAKQKALFKIKVEDFLVMRKKILDKYDGQDELDALVNLQAEETLAMNDVLTRIQMGIYKKIKPEIQPLKMVQN